MTARTWSADELVERIYASCLAAFDVHAMYLGVRLGYYGALAVEGPATPPELAHRTGTAERYAREWLEQQVVTGLLVVDNPEAAPDDRSYSLPPGYAEVLTDRDSLNFVAPTAVQVAAAGRQLAAVAEAFRSGGGVAWARYGDDMRWAQGEMNRQVFLNVLGERWLPQIPDVHARLSRDGARVADIGCGYGWSAIGIGRAYRKAMVDGYDVDEPSIEMARKNAAEMGVERNVSFHVAEASALGGGGRYDLAIALECIHDMGDPVSVLAAMRQLTEPDGAVLVVDEAAADRFAPDGDDLERLLYGFSITTCLPDGMSHPASVGTGAVMRTETLARYAEAAGFSSVEVLPIAHEQFRVYRLHP